ncbi:MAG: hypothetical protein HQM11_13840 [SAR324 cluster bacterium]|nr:hypothetical protein [Desulfobulbaceae bacterium]MBF0352109.1 hypothetical protein [SAR324 cluster bacterium]
MNTATIHIPETLPSEIVQGLIQEFEKMLESKANEVNSQEWANLVESEQSQAWLEAMVAQVDIEHSAEKTEKGGWNR